MATLEHLDRQMRAASGLLSIVKTMKTLSAVKIAEFERAARASDALEEIAETALQGALAGLELEEERDEQPTPRIAVLVGSDHGLCGAFNEELIRFALDRLLEDGAAETHLLCIGDRAEALLRRHEFASREPLEQSSAAAGVARLADRVFERVDAIERVSGAAHIILFHNQREHGGRRRCRARRLAPLDRRYLAALARRPWPGPTPPLSLPPSSELLPFVARQLVYARAYRALAASLAAEHAARLATMQAAERNIDDKLGELEDAYHGLRQEQITHEIAELHAALAGEYAID